jgi:biopolymer transport protein ExbD
MRRARPILAVVAAAAAGFACAPDSPRVPPVVVNVDIGADSLCHVRAASLRCEDVGAYLRDVAKVQVSADIHLVPDVKSPYEPAKTALDSLKRSGFRKLGFAASEDAQSAAPDNRVGTGREQ